MAAILPEPGVIEELTGIQDMIRIWKVFGSLKSVGEEQ
jgi:hypothetical protein